MLTVSEVTAQAEAHLKVIGTSPKVADRESAIVKVLALAESYPYVPVPGLGGARLSAKRSHLREVVRSLEVADTKTASGHPALGQRKRELRSERDMLIRSIRAEEDRLLAVLEGTES